LDSANSLRIVPSAALAGFGGAHHFAVLRDRAFAFQHLHDDRPEAMNSHSSP
jgi:hypothetical protein